MPFQLNVSNFCISHSILVPIHIRWVPCHHGMAQPQVVDGEDILQIWRVAANVLNKQSGTVDKRWSSSFGVLGMRLPTPHRKNKGPQTWTDSLDR
jgi:hypothetical protein